MVWADFLPFLRGVKRAIGDAMMHASAPCVNEGSKGSTHTLPSMCVVVFVV